MVQDYRSTCPKRAVIAVHHTIGTWLPIVLDCGHRQLINWTADTGDQVGCLDCGDILAVTRSQVQVWSHLAPSDVLERIGAWLPERFPELSHARTLEVLDQIVKEFQLPQPIFCERCGEQLSRDSAVWLELNKWSGRFYQVGSVKEEDSQGCFPFGSACARDVLNNKGKNLPIRHAKR